MNRYLARRVTAPRGACVGAGTALVQWGGKVAVHQLGPIAYSWVLLLFSLGLAFIIQQKNLMLSISLNAAARLS